MTDLLIRGGTLMLPTGRAVTDVAVAHGVITGVGPHLASVGAAETIDASGLVVLPGVVDAHVHFNEPGRSDWEGWGAGTRGAAAGGVTTVLEMPLNAHPPTTTAAAFDLKQAAAARAALVDYGLWGGLVPDNIGELTVLAARGVVGFKAFMCDSGIDDFRHVTEGVLAIGIKAVAQLDGLVGVHAESPELLGGADGATDRRSWSRARPVAAEVAAIRRLLVAMRGAGKRAPSRTHVVHVSSPEGLAQINAARLEGVDISAETCPHYLAFTEDDFEQVGPPLKCAPPLRAAAARDGLWTELLAGRVDFVASDHSPCPADAKTRGEDDIWQAWGGVSGIQSTLPLLLTEGVHARGMTLEQVAELTATGPAQRFGLYPRKGAIVAGADADFALVDPDRTWTFEPAHLQTRSGISPYVGRSFRGAVVRTIVRGTTVFVDGEITGTPGWGTLLRPRGRHAH